jgi:hypothetical protein
VSRQGGVARVSAYPLSRSLSARAQLDPGRRTGQCPARIGSHPAEEVETIRRVLLEAATSTSRESWATRTCPECGKGFRQEISVPDHGARIKAIETLLREGLGRVGEADAAGWTLPSTLEDLRSLTWSELNLVFALAHTTEIRAVLSVSDPLRPPTRRVGVQGHPNHLLRCSNWQTASAWPSHHLSLPVSAPMSQDESRRNADRTSPTFDDAA